MATIAKFNKFLLTQMNGGQDNTGGSTPGAARVIDFDTDTLKVSLHTSAYVPNAATQAAFNSVTNEVSGAGYTAGGSTLSGVTLTDTAGVITFDANDITWLQNAGGFSNARWAVIRKDTGTAATSTLFAVIDLGGDKGNVSGDFILQFNALGIASWA